MIITCFLIGITLSAIITAFRLENGATRKQAIMFGIIMSAIITLMVYGFFCGIKGLCPYLGRY